MEFNQRLKEVRKEKKISQQKLADIMQTKQQTVSKWENGLLEPNYNDLKKLCKLFEVSADYLIGLENEFGFKEEFEYTDGTHQIKHKK